MSAGCPSQAPCSDLWKSLQAQWQGQDWCQNCGDDTACRISGWPVLNISASCDTSSGKWLFGDGGKCCASSDESIQLAHWVGTMCNGSEWRLNFNRSGGMAKDDWKEWILPWNETVSPRDVDPHAQNQPPGCSKARFYLGVFFIENLVYLLAAIAFGIFRLWWIKRKEEKFTEDGSSEKGIPHVLWKHDDGTQDAIKPSFATRSWFGAYLPLIVGILLAGSQIGLNMASAYIIQRTPGYGHVNVTHLGLLFCSRPRLTWLTCVLGLLRKWLPKKFFTLKISQTAAKATLASVAVSSTISEGILQIIGIYYMAITANSGRVKGFYAPHHLQPYERGMDAWHMYVGALMWLLVCVPVIVIWPALAMFHARIFFLLHKARINLWSLLHVPHNPINPYSQQAASFSQHGWNEERNWLFVPTDINDWNQAGRPPPEELTDALINSSELDEASHGSHVDLIEAGGGTSPLHPHEMTEAGSLPRPHRLTGGSSSMSIHPEEWQEAGGGHGMSRLNTSSHGISSIASPSPSGIIIRRNLPSSGLRGGDATNEEIEMYSTGLRNGSSYHHAYEESTPLPPRNRSLPTNQSRNGTPPFTSLRGGAGDDKNEDRYYQKAKRRAPPGGAQYQKSKQVSGEQSLQRHGSLRVGSAAWNTDMPAVTKFDYYHFQAPIIWLGVVIGLISYAAQWLFWDGFVKASGERFCHPKLPGTAVTWAVGSVFGKFVLFAVVLVGCLLIDWI
ncbi:hypothetical protein E6O75_ATG04730 [Venturia nashicola]|uniref:Uncharacterized protein n=1 Tax=Venturia nashicola TaxID=86259 RepID=A0A4Z1PEL5_9PEZI|nr:hypothetical protein E6O75_ATG04730 [Venturia nashicola]